MFRVRVASAGFLLAGAVITGFAPQAAANQNMCAVAPQVYQTAGACPNSSGTPAGGAGGPQSTLTGQSNSGDPGALPQVPSTP